MSKLELAAERLTKAMNALEARLVPLQGARADAQTAKAEAERARAEAESAKADAAASKSRLADLHAERESLLARIAELEDEAKILGEISEEVETRLDGAITEIRSALGR